MDPDTRLALRALVDAYAVAVDQRDAEAFVGVFAPDGILDVLDAEGRRLGGYRGHAELAQVTERVARYHRTLHLVSTHRCVAAPAGEVAGVAYCEAHHLTPADDGDGWDDRVLSIRYDDRYRHTIDGWAIAGREVHTLWVRSERVTSR